MSKHELILYLRKGMGLPAKARPEWFVSVMPVPRPQSNFREGRFHATQKPIGLMRRLVDFQEAQMVIDPCMGSGSTLRAAKDLGYQAIGIDIEEANCEIAARRMAQSVMLPADPGTPQSVMELETSQT